MKWWFESRRLEDERDEGESLLDPDAETTRGNKKIRDKREIASVECFLKETRNLLRSDGKGKRRD